MSARSFWALEHPRQVASDLRGTERVVMNRSGHMKISIVDTSPILAGSTAVEALRTTQQLAELADRAGYSRYWLSELHGVPTNAGTAPEVGVAAVASRTRNFRVGSG